MLLYLTKHLEFRRKAQFVAFLKWLMVLYMSPLILNGFLKFEIQKQEIFNADEHLTTPNINQLQILVEEGFNSIRERRENPLSISVLLVQSRSWESIMVLLILIAISVLFLLVFGFRALRRRSSLTREKKKDQNPLLGQLELQQSLEIRNRMMTILSHDLKGPARFLGEIVAAIKTKMECNQGSNCEKEIQHLECGIRHFNQRIHLVLAWMNGAYQISEPLEIWCDLTKIWRACLEEHQLMAERVGLKIHAERPKEDLAPLKCEAEALKLILNNLFTNALRFAKEEVYCRISLKQGLYYLTIEDDGAGIPCEKDLESLNQGRGIPSKVPEGEAEGSGMGLLIVHDLIRRNGAQVSFANGPRGLKVTLCFEAQKPSEAS